MPDINDLIEIIRNVDDSPTSECGFDMSYEARFRDSGTDHACGTACCIGGHAALALGHPEAAPEAAVVVFGVGNAKDAKAICYPPEEHSGWFSEPHHAVRLLTHYRDHGVVDWDLAMRDPGEDA